MYRLVLVHHHSVYSMFKQENNGQKGPQDPRWLASNRHFNSGSLVEDPDVMVCLYESQQL